MNRIWKANPNSRLINPVEHGLANHEPILEIIRTDPDYPAAFQSVFGVSGEKITIDHVAKAIASFERTLVSGNSPSTVITSKAKPMR